MSRTFFIVGPAATGKSELAADVACAVGARLVPEGALSVHAQLAGTSYRE
jgi:tRNA A37 N6-isopentenylltransferase MiaA